MLSKQEIQRNWYYRHHEEIKERKRKQMANRREQRRHPCVDCGEPCDIRVKRCRACAGKLRRGRHLSDETKLKLSAIFKEQYATGKRPKPDWNRGRAFPQISGNKSPFWKGGHAHWRGAGYFALRTSLFYLVGRQCELCGATDGNKRKTLRTHA